MGTLHENVFSPQYKKVRLFLLRPDDEVSLPYEPVVKFMGAVKAMGRTNRPDFFIFGRFFLFFIQKQLYRTFHIMTIFTTLIIGIPLHN
jgi:hypothetical protein